MSSESKSYPKPAPPRSKSYPKPAPPRSKAPVVQETEKPNATEKDKPKYIRKPHLTEKPFKEHEGLVALKKQMDKSKPHGQRRNKKEKK